MLVTLAVILGGIWVLLGLVCTLRVIGRICRNEDGSSNTQTLILLLIFTHMAGMGVLVFCGFVWAAWIMVSAPIKWATNLPPRNAPPAPTGHAGKDWTDVPCPTCNRNDCGHAARQYQFEQVERGRPGLVPADMR